MNTILLGLVDYSNPWLDANGQASPNPTILANYIIDQANDVCLVLFIAEAMMKIITLGFVGGNGHSYLSDHWNKLDFFVIVSG